MQTRSRPLLWLQLLIGWLPVGAIFAILIASVHGGTLHSAAVISLRMMLVAAALGVFVYRLTLRIRWPYPFRPQFLLLHILGAIAYSAAWLVMNSAIESV